MSKFYFVPNTLISFNSHYNDVVYLVVDAEPKSTKSGKSSKVEDCAIPLFQKLTPMTPTSGMVIHAFML